MPTPVLTQSERTTKGASLYNSGRGRTGIFSGSGGLLRVVYGMDVEEDRPVSFLGKELFDRLMDGQR